MTLRILRTFVWLRWRVLVNSLERTGARDAIERFSLAIDKLGPMIALALLIPSSMAMGALATIGGFGIATGSWIIPFEVLRYLLLAAVGFCVLGPIVLPTRDAGNPVRFLLLPIPRPLLYAAHLCGTLAEPWILLSVPALVGAPLGVAIGGRFTAALAAFVAGIALLLLLVGLTSLTSSVIHLLLRNRRRGDLVMLVLILVIPAISMLPGALRIEQHAGRGQHTPARGRTPTAFSRAADQAAGWIPSELYYRTATQGVVQVTRAVTPMLGVLAAAGLVQLLGFVAFRRMLDMPQTLGARHAGSLGGLWARRIPGLTPGASAVALTQLRLALRSTRGRSILASPLMIFAMFAVILRRQGGLPFAGLSISDGITLAAFSSFIALFAVLPIAANQFAVDSAGFTRVLLSPLHIRELLAGKAVGNALIAAGPAFCCLAISALLFPGGDPALWLTIPIAWLATYTVMAPVVAALSAVFPKAVDLGSIGNAGNAHQAAAMLGMLAFLASTGVSIAVVLAATRWLHRPAMSPLLVSGWLLIALVLSRVIFAPVARLVDSRRETLAQYY